MQSRVRCPGDVPPKAGVEPGRVHVARRRLSAVPGDDQRLWVDRSSTRPWSTLRSGRSVCGLQQGLQSLAREF